MRRLGWNGFTVMAALGVTACTASTTAGMTTTEAWQADETAAGELREHHRHHHRGGVMQFVAMSLDTLGPDDAKRPQVEQLQRDLHGCMAPTSATHGRLLQAVAEGVAAGAIDAVRVGAVIAELDPAELAIQECGAETLNRLHAILSPSERAELTEKVQAHWAVWREVNPDGGATGTSPGGRLPALTAELSLSQDQVTRISAALQLSGEGRGRRFDRARAEGGLNAFAEAFARDPFDARALPRGSSMGLAHHGASRMASFYETVTPLLTQPQRATLAQHLREHASHTPTLSLN
ncbi:MAG: hypothetical protein HZB56_18075 [Deltaproteobacteria bacterium]|nr:hypothetical protein [Deltaproteobacteria bacterium]